MANLDHFSGSITSATSVANFDTISNTGFYVQFLGTYAGVTVVFEGTVDGGTTWIPLSSFQLNIAGSSPTALSQTLTTNGTQQFYVFVGACQQARVRATAWTSGTAAYDVLAVLDADPVQPSASGSTAVSNFPSAAASADNTANPTTTSVYADEQWFNGTTWDRVRNNTTGIAVDTTAARTASGNGVTATNYNARGAHIFINVTASSGTTPTLVVRLQGSVDGTNFYDIDTTNASTASITATGTAVIKLYPGFVAAVGNANQALPRIWRCAWVIGGTTPSFTFTTTAAYIL